jgi:hypothetical protein
LVQEKAPHRAVVASPGRVWQGDTAEDAVPVIFREYHLGEQVEAVVITAERAATEVVTYLTARDE